MEAVEDINSIVLFGNTESAPAPEVKGEPAAPPAAEPEQKSVDRDEHGKFKAAENPAESKPEAKPEGKPTEPAKAERGQMAALLAERAKRQELEQKLAQLMTNQQPKQPTDFYEDPAKAIQEQVSQAIAPFRQTFFNQSIKLAESSHDDFDDAISHFMEVAENNPELMAAWTNHENPGEFAYFIGSTTPQYRQAYAKKFSDQVSAKDAEISTLKARIAELESASQRIAELPGSLNRQPSGPVPAREGNDLDIRNIVRFK